MKRFVANAVIAAGKVLKNAYAETDGVTVSVSPFREETPSTVFVPGVLLFVNSEPDAALLDDIRTAVSHASSVDEAVKIIMSRVSFSDAENGKIFYYTFLLSHKPV